MAGVTRRGVLAAGVGGGAGLLAPSADAASAVTWPGPPVTAADWSQAYGYADHLSWNRAERRLSPATARRITTLWENGLGDEWELSGAASAVGTSCYVAWGWASSRVSRLDAASGAFRWTRSYASQGLPAYSHGILVLVGDELTGVDARTGAQLWTHSWGQAPSPVTLHGDAVYHAPGDERINCFDLMSGRLRWTWIDEAETGYRYPWNPPTIMGSRLFAGCGGNQVVVALDRVSGRVLWRRRLSAAYADERAQLTADSAGRLFVMYQPTRSSNSRLAALSQATGATLWSVALPGEQRSGAVLAGNTLVVSTQGRAVDTGVICAFDSRTGRARWRRDERPYHPEMAAGGGLLIHTTSMSRGSTSETVVTILSLASGAPLRSVRIPGFPQAGPTLARGRIFVTVSGPPYGRVVCLGVPPG